MEYTAAGLNSNRNRYRSSLSARLLGWDSAI